VSPRAPEASVQTGGPFGALLALVAVTSLVLVATIGAQPAASLSLTLNYNGVLEVILANGTHIRTSSAPGAVIAPGTYAAVVNNDVADDRDGYHVFHLSGRGVNLQTDLLAGDEKAELFTVTLEPSSVYTFQDDRQPDLAHVVFSTSAAGSGTPAPSGGSSTSSSGSGKSSGSVANSDVVGSAVLRFRGALDATVYKNGKLALNRSGKAVSKLKQGRYTFSVDDESKTAGFTLKSLRGKPVTITSKAFVGAHNVTRTLKQGRWFFYSRGGKQHQFIVFS
jgi:hypothetical protein